MIVTVLFWCVCGVLGYIEAALKLKPWQLSGVVIAAWLAYWMAS